MIILDAIRLQRGTSVLLENAGATIHANRKIALIGANGSGKSSLFQLLMGSLQPDAGESRVPPDWRIAHMAQEVAASDRSALDFVLDGDAELRRIEADMRRAETEGDNHRLASLFQQFEDADGYTARSRAEKLLHGLGFGGDEVHRPVDSFSGGWRIRLNLAQALMRPSELLLLDEPTNHLDIDACLWLEDWLRQYPGTLMLISHDRDFIDAVCDEVVHIEHRQLWQYRGNYSAFERQRSERLARQQATYLKQQQRVAEIHKFVDRFRAKATKARQAQSRLKELERMELVAPAHVDSPFDFHFPVPEKVSDPLLNLSDAALGYGGNAVLEKINLSIHPGSRIGLLGANGQGKSTLIRSLAGELPLIGGERTAGEHLRIGYFSQHQVDVLDPRASPLLHLQRLTPGATEQVLRNFLGGFDFRGDMALSPVATFSGGEKARLALAIIVWQKPNLLLLDEPTNHLDLEMCHALTVALQEFEGAVILVSHDRHLIRNTVDSLVLVSDGRISEYKGDLSDYGRWLLAKIRELRTDDAPACGNRQSEEVDRRQQRREAARKREQLAPLAKKLSGVEKSIARLDKQLADIDGTLADQQLYEESEKDRLQALLKEQGRLKQDKQELEAVWFEHYEALEALKAGPDA